MNGRTALQPIRSQTVKKYLVTQFNFSSIRVCLALSTLMLSKRFRLYGQDNQPISTSQLHTLLCFHTSPINVVVFNGLHGKTHLKGGFPLRCFQRLSRPNLATRQCHWRDNRYTRGSSTSVLSYWKQLLSIFLRPRQIGTELSHDVLNPARVPL
jgi:hypothetical protein